MTSLTKIKRENWRDYVLDNILVRDIRFPTSDFSHGSDAMHKDPDYSAAYCVLSFVNQSENSSCGDDIPMNINGYGMSFTLGRGNEVLCQCIEALFPFIKGLSVDTIVADIGAFAHRLTNESQFRWLGPEKGVSHMASCALINGVFDLWARLEGKPLWQLIVEMPIDTLLNCVSWQYISDYLDRSTVRKLLIDNQSTMKHRLNILKKEGYPVYTTGAGWLGYTDDEVVTKCKYYLSKGFRAFKMKVGRDLNDDRRRAKLIRSTIGDNCLLMADANQIWDISTAIEWMTALKEFNFYWIEEPTSPDDILGHKRISEALNPLHIKVATGEHCQNRIIFKQFIQSNALQICQPDTARLNSIPELLGVLLMAQKADIPICFHAGGVGLNEMARHWSMIDYLLISAKKDDRMCEFAQHLAQHFFEGAQIENGKYYPPQMTGYTRFKPESINRFQYPNGQYWSQKLNSKL